MRSLSICLSDSRVVIVTSTGGSTIRSMSELSREVPLAIEPKTASRLKPPHVLDRYELAESSEQEFEILSNGQQERFQILLLELSGATLLLLDEPTDNLDLASGQALEVGLDAFDGTVVAVTHDRWFAKNFDRFIYVGNDKKVVETIDPRRS